MGGLVVDAIWHEDGDLRGYVLVAADRSADLRAIHGWPTWVVGSRFYGDAVCDPAFAPGSPLRLTADPTNPEDPNAVGVWDAAGRILIGHLERRSVQGVSRAIIAGEDRPAICLREWTHAGMRRAIRVLVTHEPVTIRRVELATLDQLTAGRLARAAASHDAS